MDWSRVTPDGWAEIVGSVLGAVLAVLGAYLVGRRGATREAEKALENARSLEDERRAVGRDRRRAALLVELQANLEMLHGAWHHQDFGRVQVEAWHEAGALQFSKEFVRPNLIAAYVAASVYDRAVDKAVSGMAGSPGAEAAGKAQQAAKRAFEAFEEAERLLRVNEFPAGTPTTEHGRA